MSRPSWMFLTCFFRYLCTAAADLQLLPRRRASLTPIPWQQLPRPNPRWILPAPWMMFWFANQHSVDEATGVSEATGEDTMVESDDVGPSLEDLASVPWISKMFVRVPGFYCAVRSDACCALDVRKRCRRISHDGQGPQLVMDWTPPRRGRPTNHSSPLRRHSPRSLHRIGTCSTWQRLAPRDQ